MKAKIVFCDTNIIFGLFYRVLQWLSITNSSIVEISQYYDIYISRHVIQELEVNILEKYWSTFDDIDLNNFVNNTNIQIINSRELDENINDFVFDPNDAQILQDALNIRADFLITQNMKDFNIIKIVETFDLNIINRLPPIPI